MPTMTELQVTTIDDIVKAMGIGIEEVERLANDALTDILTAKLAMREALIPVYNEYVEDQKSNNVKLDATWTPKVRDLNAYLFGLAKGRKLGWKYSDALIDELVYKLDAHDDDQVAKYVLWCVDGQGKYADGPRKGQAKPQLTPNYDGYVRWLPTRENYSKLGIETPTAKAERLATEAKRTTNERRQLTTTNYVDEYRADDELQVRIEALMRMRHDVNRALLLIKAEADKTDDGKAAWTKASTAFNKAFKGEKA